MKILQLGSKIRNAYAEEFDILSSRSLLDADIIVIDLYALSERFHQVYIIPSQVKSDTSYIADLKRVIQNKRKEFEEFLSMGRKLFVLLSSEAIFRTTVVNSNEHKSEVIDFKEIFPVDMNGMVFQKQTGNNVEFIDSFEVFNWLKPYCSYSMIVTKHNGIANSHINGTKKVVSFSAQYKNSSITFLPKISSDVVNDGTLSKKFCDRLIEFDQKKVVQFASGKEFIIPEWCKSYRLGEEEKEEERLLGLKAELEKAERKYHEQVKILKCYEQLKTLICGDGNPLENICEKIFKDFGYEVEAPENNRDDLILKYSENVGVVEIKGLKKSAGEKNAAQLMKWVNNYHIENEFLPKGILIVNTFKEKQLVERTEVSFPEQMIPYCKRMGISLLTSVQLLQIYLDFKSGNLTFEQVHEIVFNAEGRLVYENQQIQHVEEVLQK